MATYLYVVVGKLAVLVVVHAQQLGLLAGAQVQAGHHVDGLGDEGRHDKRVGGAGDQVGNLDVQLLPVLVEPATRDDAGADAVEADDVVGGEEGVEDQADHAADAVLSKHVERVVNADQELNLGGEIAGDAGDD